MQWSFCDWLKLPGLWQIKFEIFSICICISNYKASNIRNIRNLFASLIKIIEISVHVNKNYIYIVIC